MAGENVPGIPGACATRNVTYLARGPLYPFTHIFKTTSVHAMNLSCLIILKFCTEQRSVIQFYLSQNNTNELSNCTTKTTGLLLIQMGIHNLTHWRLKKLLMFRIHHFHMHYIDWKCLKFRWQFHWSKCVSGSPIDIGSSFALNKRQTIIWTSDGSGGVSLTFRELSKIISRKYIMCQIPRYQLTSYLLFHWGWITNR